MGCGRVSRPMERGSSVVDTGTDYGSAVPDDSRLLDAFLHMDQLQPRRTDEQNRHHSWRILPGPHAIPVHSAVVRTVSPSVETISTSILSFSTVYTRRLRRVGHPGGGFALHDGFELRPGLVLPGRPEWEGLGPANPARGIVLTQDPGRRCQSCLSPSSLSHTGTAQVSTTSPRAPVGPTSPLSPFSRKVSSRGRFCILCLFLSFFAHPPIFGSRLESSGVRGVFLRIMRRWLGTLALCLLVAVGGVEYGRAAPSRNLYQLVLTAYRTPVPSFAASSSLQLLVQQFKNTAPVQDESATLTDSVHADYVHFPSVLLWSTATDHLYVLQYQIATLGWSNAIQDPYSMQRIHPIEANLPVAFRVHPTPPWVGVSLPPVMESDTGLQIAPVQTQELSLSAPSGQASFPLVPSTYSSTGSATHPRVSPPSLSNEADVIHMLEQSQNHYSATAAQLLALFCLIVCIFFIAMRFCIRFMRYKSMVQEQELDQEGKGSGRSTPSIPSPRRKSLSDFAHTKPLAPMDDFTRRLEREFNDASSGSESSDVEEARSIGPPPKDNMAFIMGMTTPRPSLRTDLESLYSSDPDLSASPASRSILSPDSLSRTVPDTPSRSSGLVFSNQDPRSRFPSVSSLTINEDDTL